MVVEYFMVIEVWIVLHTEVGIILGDSHFTVITMEGQRFADIFLMSVFCRTSFFPLLIALSVYVDAMYGISALPRYC